VDIDTLHSAIITDDVSYVRAAVESGAISPNERIPAPVYMEGTPLLTVAARAASLDVMRYLISAGANINAKTPAIETPLMLAAYFFREERDQGGHSNYQHQEAVRILVEAGADMENDPNNYTALSYAAYQGHDYIVRYLIEHGAHLDADAVNGGIYVNTPLMMAAIQGHRSTALQLLNAGANPRIRVHGGNTAVEFAEKYQHTHMTLMLRCAEALAQNESFRQKCGTAHVVAR
jgi:ankyrin repeat protein